MSKTIGILGGMGPEATIYLFHLIVKLTRAEKDQDHIPIVVFNNPKIPDRTSAIIGEGPSPLPFLIEGAVFLEKAGVDLILMPCVTAHYFYKEIVKHISIPFLHLLEEALAYVKRELGSLKKIGLLATDGTVQTGLFQELFHKNGVELVVPNDENQHLLMKALYQREGIKAGCKKHPKRMILQILQQLIRDKAEAVIGGCTEIPLVINQSDMEVPFINPLRILARESLRKSGYDTIEGKKITKGENK
ncbi:MAG: amino acid racemase [Candidatus Aminicenantes bacterium]|nr:MAG: amino acid racemase [Candidatus Aminicenantes bacterium]